MLETKKELRKEIKQVVDKIPVEEIEDRINQDEQEEAIETLKKMKENIDKKYLKTRNSIAIETVLNMLKEKDKEIEKKDKRINDLEFALLDMVMQFADRSKANGYEYNINTMGLSALELAFDVLGFDDPYPVKKAEEKYKILAKQYFERKAKND